MRYIVDEDVHKLIPYLNSSNIAWEICSIPIVWRSPFLYLH